MSARPCRLRLSPALRALVDATSPNASAAQRALMLLGASLVGYDLSACRADLGRLLGEELDPRVRVAIDALYGYRSPGVGQPPHDRPTAGLHPAHQAATAVPRPGHTGSRASSPAAQGRAIDPIPQAPEPLTRPPDGPGLLPAPSPPDDDLFTSLGIDV